MSSPSWPLTVTRPSLVGCLNWRWLPLVTTSVQPSSCSIRITSRTFTRLQYQMHNPRPLFGAAEPECSLMKPHHQCRAFDTPEASGQGADRPTPFALTPLGSWGTVGTRRCHSALRREHRGPIPVADAGGPEPLRPPARARPGDAQLPW